MGIQEICVSSTFRISFANSTRLNSNMSVIVGLDGYTLPGQFVLKEICIQYPNGEFNHYLLKKPDGYLSELALKTVRYTTEHLSNLSYEDGDIPYNMIGDILDKIKDLRIYTYSDIAQRFLQNYLPTTAIENVQNRGYQLPKQLPDPKCFRSHNPRYCAKAKALAIKKFLDL